MTTTATKGTEGNSNKKKPLNPITIVWYTHYIPDTQTSYYAIDAVVTLRETKEVKQFSLTAKTREELLTKLFKKLGYNLKEEFKQDLSGAQIINGN